jgi:streptogramin lyase
MSRDLRAGRVLFRRMLLLVLFSILVDLLQEDKAVPLEESSSLPSDPTPTSMKGLNGVVREFSLPTSDTSPTDITTGSDGNLWFTEVTADAQSGTIGRITPDGVISEFPLPTSHTYPLSITSGSDGNLWFTEGSSITPGPDGLLSFNAPGKIGRITPTGEISEFPLPSNRFPSHITAGSDGNLWFTVFDISDESSTIGRITPDGVISAFPLPTSDATPSAIVAGPDGALWFLEKVGFKGRGSSIGRITPSGDISEFPLPSTSHPTHITVGPDGALWFTEDGAIGRITPTGTISEFPLPTRDSHPSRITTGPDGALWFTEDGAIGHLD